MVQKCGLTEADMFVVKKGYKINGGRKAPAARKPPPRQANSGGAVRGWLPTRFESQRLSRPRKAVHFGRTLAQTLIVIWQEVLHSLS